MFAVSIAEPFSKTVSSERTLREIGVLEKPARLADDVPKLVLDRLKMRVDPLAAGSLQCTEQLIAPRFTSLSF